MKGMVKDYKIRRTVVRTIVAMIILWGIFTFLIYPNLKLLKITLFPANSFDFAPVKQILFSQRVLRSMKNSFMLAVCLTITVNILGIFQILVLDYFQVKGSKWLNIAYHSPLVCNGMVLVMAYNFLFGGQGFVTANLIELFPNMNPLWFTGFGAVLLEMTFAGTSNHIMFVRDSLRSIDYQTIEAAQNMGVKSSRILQKIVLPTLKPSVFAASILTFIVGMSAFATPQVLGGENFETINPLIHAFSNTLTTRNYAAVLAIFLGFVTIIVLMISNHIEKKGNYRSVSKVKTKLKKQKIQNPVLRWGVTVAAHTIALIQTIPLLFIFIFSFMPVTDLYAGKIQFENMGLKNYVSVFTSTTGIRPVFTSIIYSVLAAVIVVSIMLFLARIITKEHTKASAALELMLQIPWFLPATLIALGLVMTFANPTIFVFGQTLTGTAVLMLVGYVIIRTPYTLRMMKAAYTSLDGALEEAAKNLGASSLKTYFSVLLPILMPTVLSVFLLNFIGVLAEYNVSVFLFHPMYQPLGVMLNAATRADASPDAQMLSFVYSVLIMIVSTITIVFVHGGKLDTSKRRSKKG